ncbi:MAG TPA: squalene--hopene cyclase [Chthoniobacteraceae bacterium]|nr:squalene--hopene cyclase [Chthoniobacteraceae bacterium]
MNPLERSRAVSTFELRPGRLSESLPPGSLEAELQATIGRTQEYFFSEQKEGSYWIGELFVDVTLIADMVAFYHWWDRVDLEWERKAVNHIFSKQLPEGGWNIYPNGPAEVNATIKAYLALKLAGIEEEDPRMLKARAVAYSLGGVPRMNTFSKLYLALLGLVEWRHVPTIPCEVLLIGKWFHVNFWEMSNWTRAMLVPLAIINHFRPTRAPRCGVSLDELYPHGKGLLDETLRPHFFDFTVRNGFLWLDRLNKFAEWVARKGFHPFRRKALARAEAWMLERFEGSDGLAAIFPAILNSLIALKALGYADDHPEVTRAHGELIRLMHEEKESVRMEPCLSPVWDTAIVSLAMLESGVAADHPAIQSAAVWLMEREIRFAGDWVHKNPARVEPSGWVFEFNNKWNPDVDDTAMVLLALRLAKVEDAAARDACLKRAITWLLTFQCKDGGWAAFDKDCTKSILETVPFADHNAMLDPECPDITARILELLGHEGYPLDHPQVAVAVEYLKRQQMEDGSWYGRWGVNYIYGTWQVLRGMKALKADMNEPWLVRGRDWLRRVQHPNGGWGERCNTYDDPVFKGMGASTPSQTAWAVMGLCVFGDPHDPWLKAGVEWLLENQNADGTWTEDEITGTGFPCVFYLQYDTYRNGFPLLALAAYRRLLEQERQREEERIDGILTRG